MTKASEPATPAPTGPRTLAELLGVGPEPEPEVDYTKLTAREFANYFVQSADFRHYIIDGLKARTLPSAIVLRVLDYSDWGKPVERVEHTGKDGQPIETFVRRVIVRVTSDIDEALGNFDRDEQDKPTVMH